MGKYLVTLEPLEPYFFGGERTFGFGREIMHKQPYYIVSEKTPSQTSLFGTLRYIILSQNNALIGQSQAGESERLVGKESFSFEKSRLYITMVQEATKDKLDTPSFVNDQMQVKKAFDQSFGVINNISPMFLIRGETWYVRLPFNHNPGKKSLPNKTYTPFVMEKLNVSSGNGTRLFPTDYKAKDGYGDGYVSLDEKLSIIYDYQVFLSHVRTGINSHRTENSVEETNGEDSFFKKERKMLSEGFAFAFIADVKDSLSPDNTVVFMGQDKSPFRCVISKTNEELVEKVKSVFKERNSVSIKYALSDVMPVENSFPGKAQFDYYITGTKVIRNLESNMSANSYCTRLKKSEKLYKLITAGSVFYTNKENFCNDALKKIGMNILVDI